MQTALAAGRIGHARDSLRQIALKIGISIESVAMETRYLDFIAAAGK